MRFAAGLALLLATGVSGCASGLNLSSIGATPTGAAAANAALAPRKTTFDPFKLHGDQSSGRREVIAKPTLAQVLDPGPLPDNVYGSPTAPVVIVKYASLTCPYCRRFHARTFPQLKREYIDTGKVRFILREFPIGFQSGTATIAWRCAPPAKRLDLYGRFLAQQSRWVSQDVRKDPIYRIARQVGLGRAALDRCFADQALLAGLKAKKDRGRTLGIIGTPNFFINTRLEKRVLTMKDIRAIVDPLLAERR